MTTPDNAHAYNALMSGLNARQRALLVELLDQCRANIELGSITADEQAQVLERIAHHTRCNEIAAFTLPATFKPTVRMTRRSMHADPQVREYLDSKMRLAVYLQQQLRGRPRPLLPPQTPLAVRIELPRAAHNRDLDNEIKAAVDSANGVLWHDDRWIDAITATRGHNADCTQMTVGVLGEQ